MQRRDYIRACGLASTPLLAGCLGGGSTGSQAVEIIDQRSGITQAGNPTVRGRAENTSGQEVGYAQIQVRFFDASETRVGSGMDNITNLGPGITWEFEALCLDCPDPSRVDSYEIEVTAEF